MRRLILLLVTATLAALLVPTGAAAAAAPVLDGMRLTHLPAGLGASSDFAYEFDDVAFVSRDWESRVGDGWRVDLSIDVLRGEHLHSAGEMHDWVIGYEERPPAEATFHRTTVRGQPGWRCADEVFWLVRPGVAVVVRLDTGRWSQRELTRTARGVLET